MIMKNRIYRFRHWFGLHTQFHFIFIKCKSIFRYVRVQPKLGGALVFQLLLRHNSLFSNFICSTKKNTLSHLKYSNAHKYVIYIYLWEWPYAFQRRLAVTWPTLCSISHENVIMTMSCAVENYGVHQAGQCYIFIVLNERDIKCNFTAIPHDWLSRIINENLFSLLFEIQIQY